MSTDLISICCGASAMLAASTLRQIMRHARRQAVSRLGGQMVIWLVSLILLIEMSPALRAEETAGPGAASLAAARAAIKGLGETLKAQLVAAIKDGGPVAAIGVCRSIAPAMAEDQSHAHGVRVGRTALKVRNPANAPDAFERRVLEDFVRKIDAGADPSSLEDSETVMEGGEKVFRYMKAIPTAQNLALRVIKPAPRPQSRDSPPIPERRGNGIQGGGAARRVYGLTEAQVTSSGLGHPRKPYSYLMRGDP